MLSKEASYKKNPSCDWINNLSRRATLATLKSTGDATQNDRQRRSHICLSMEKSQQAILHCLILSETTQMALSQYSGGCVGKPEHPLVEFGKTHPDDASQVICYMEAVGMVPHRFERATVVAAHGTLSSTFQPWNNFQDNFSGILKLLIHSHTPESELKASLSAQFLITKVFFFTKVTLVNCNLHSHSLELTKQACSSRLLWYVFRSPSV